VAAYQKKHPSWNPAANPVKLRCDSGVVFGWVYTDGTVELICRNRACGKPGTETRHVFNANTGLYVNLHVDKHAVDATGKE